MQLLSRKSSQRTVPRLSLRPKKTKERHKPVVIQKELNPKRKRALPSLRIRPLHLELQAISRSHPRRKRNQASPRRARKTRTPMMTPMMPTRMQVSLRRRRKPVTQRHRQPPKKRRRKQMLANRRLRLALTRRTTTLILTSQPVPQNPTNPPKTPLSKKAMTNPPSLPKTPRKRTKRRQTYQQKMTTKR